MMVPKHSQLTEQDLREGCLYCAFFIEFDNQTDQEWHQDGTLFTYLGDNEAEIAANAVGEENEVDSVPYADFYVLQA